MPGRVIGRPAVVADGALVALLLDRDIDALRPVARRGRLHRTGTLHADDIAAAIEEGGADVLVAARAPLADPSAAALAALAAAAGVAGVRLPDAPAAAAWTIGWAARLWRAGAPLAAAHRAVQVLAGLAPQVDTGGGIPCDRRDVGAWAARAWRACVRCHGGGAPGAACGGCGIALAAAVTA